MGADKPDPEVPDPQVRERGRPRSYSAAYKARILEEYDRLDKAGKGALLRGTGRSCIEGSGPVGPDVPRAPEVFIHSLFWARYPIRGVGEAVALPIHGERGDHEPRSPGDLLHVVHPIQAPPPTAVIVIAHRPGVALQARLRQGEARVKGRVEFDQQHGAQRQCDWDEHPGLPRPPALARAQHPYEPGHGDGEHQPVQRQCQCPVGQAGSARLDERQERSESGGRGEEQGEGLRVRRMEGSCPMPGPSASAPLSVPGS